MLQYPPQWAAPQHQQPPPVGSTAASASANTATASATVRGGIYAAKSIAAGRTAIYPTVPQRGGGVPLETGVQHSLEQPWGGGAGRTRRSPQPRDTISWRQGWPGNATSSAGTTTPVLSMNNSAPVSSLQHFMLHFAPTFPRQRVSRC